MKGLDWLAFKFLLLWCLFGHLHGEDVNTEPVPAPADLLYFMEYFDSYDRRIDIQVRYLYHSLRELRNAGEECKGFLLRANIEKVIEGLENQLEVLRNDLEITPEKRVAYLKSTARIKQMFIDIYEKVHGVILTDEDLAAIKTVMVKTNESLKNKDLISAKALFLDTVSLPKSGDKELREFVQFYASASEGAGLLVENGVVYVFPSVCLFITSIQSTQKFMQ